MTQIEHSIIEKNDGNEPFVIRATTAVIAAENENKAAKINMNMTLRSSVIPQPPDTKLGSS